jgi:predicted regulator of Ras-like GTPase activity (Roadblock/LC7/MglB family)
MSVTDSILYDTMESLNGALLAGVIGTDGLSVEMVVFDDDLPHDRYEAEAELSALVASAGVTSLRLGVGKLNDLILETDDITYLLSYIMPGYYAVLGVEAGRSLGRVRFAMRDLIARLLEEL